MGLHCFSLNPRTILGVGVTASLEEIHEAYRLKAKKHHPDAGGDEWAFQMVARAYEVLRATAALPAGSPGNGDCGDRAPNSQVSDWPWATSNGSFTPADEMREGTGESGAHAAGHAAQEHREAPSTWQTGGPDDSLNLLRIVHVELIWSRFQSQQSEFEASSGEADDGTLSVCIVITWPPESVVDRAVDFPASSEIIRLLIESFEKLRVQQSVVAARSRIENGRFVGWLSYPDVLSAQDAFLALRQALECDGITIKLRTRDECIPIDWRSPRHDPVTQQQG